MRLSTRDIVLVGAFAGLAAASAVLLRVGGQGIVPYSPLPFVALAAGLMLGRRKGPLSMLVYVLIGLAGVPVFASAPFGGLQYVLQPTFGFLLGFAAAAFVSGTVLGWNGSRRSAAYILAALGGLVAVYAIGLPYLWMIFNFVISPDVLKKLGMARPVSWLAVVQIGLLPYIVFDIVKAVLAALLARQVAARVALAVPLPER